MITLEPGLLIVGSISTIRVSDEAFGVTGEISAPNAATRELVVCCDVESIAKRPHVSTARAASTGKKTMRRTVLVAELIAISLLLMVAGEADAPSSEALQIEIPKGNEIVLDGTLSPEEWKTAYRIELEGGGELLLMHHEGHLNIGLRSKREPVTSVCVMRGDEIAVLHSSAALGTAIYERVEEKWKRVREFSWECRDASTAEPARAERARHLEKEDWVGSNGRMGVAEETEIQIKMPDDELSLSVATIGSPDYTEVSWWPPRLEDGCRNLDLIQGSAPEQLDFSTRQWAVVSVSP